MTTRVIEGDLCGCCALTKPTYEVLNRRPEKKRFWNVHAAPGDPTVAPTPKSESAFAQKSLSQTKRPLELFFDKNLSFAPTPDTKYRKVLPFLAAGYLATGKLREEEDAFVHRLVTLGTERTREKYSTNSFVVPGGPAPNGEPRLYTIGTFKKEEKQGFPLRSGSRRSYSADVTITAPEERSRWASSISRCWNLPSGGLKNLRHPSTRQQRTQKHSGQHQGTFLIQPRILDSSGFHAGGTATYVSSDVIENFHVGMPSLLEEDKNIELLPAALQNAITYLAVTKFPRGRKLKKKFLLPPQAVQFANRVTLVLDMDETLMHCSLQPLETQPDFLVQFADTNLLGHVYVRPYAKLFLDLASQICEIVVFTASTQAYADQVLAQLDPENRFVQHRLYRQHCTVINGGHVKDLRLLGRDASKVVLADNSPISMALQPDNGIIVSAWTTDYHDKELMDLLMLLQHIATLNDVQEFLRSRYEFRKWINQVRPPLDPL